MELDYGKWEACTISTLWIVYPKLLCYLYPTPNKNTRFFFFKVQGKKSAHWSSDFRRYQTSKLQFHICSFKIQNESPPRPARKVVVRCEAVEGRHKENGRKVGRTLKSGRMRSMKVWSWGYSKVSFSIKMKCAFSFLRKRRRRAAVKESFLGFWSFGEFFLSPFFSSSFHFPRFTGKKGNNTD